MTATARLSAREALQQLQNWVSVESPCGIRNFNLFLGDITNVPRPRGVSSDPRQHKDRAHWRHPPTDAGELWDRL